MVVTYLLNNYLLSVHFVTGTIVGTGNRTANREKQSGSPEAYLLVGGMGIK